MKTISDIIGRDIISAIYDDNMLIKDVVERMFPECDFSNYNIICKNGIELIDEWALLNELMQTNQNFRDNVILMLDDYKNFGFFGDDEFIHKIFELAAGYEDNLEELIPVGNLEINNCFSYSADIMDRASSIQGRKQSKKQKDRRIKYIKKEKDKWQELCELTNQLNETDMNLFK